MECQICGKTFTGHGHNARPVADGRCCDVCQDTKVIPARMKWIKPNPNESDTGLGEMTDITTQVMRSLIRGGR